jgi:tetratricopeptide (TPR) repeat protein
MRKLQILRSFGFLFLFLTFFSGCQWFNGPGSKTSIKRDLRELESIAKTKPGSKEALSAAREGSQTAFVEKKDYHRALFFFKYIILYSEDESERREAQKTLAEIYFERLNNYEQAIIEYNRLLELPHENAEKFQYRMNVARSNFFLSKFSQAESEIDLVLKSEPKDKNYFEAKLLLANIFQAQKKLDSAIEIYKELMDKYPDFSRDEHLGLALALCFEEKNDFKQARATLNEIRSTYPRPEFIDSKIKHLEERESLQPGAQGFKK